MDEFVDALLTEERVCDIILPRLTKREVLEEMEELPERVSSLLDAMEGSGSEDEDGNKRAKRVAQPRRPLIDDTYDQDDEGAMEDGEMDAPGERRGRSKSGSRSRSRSSSRSAGGSLEPEGERYISRSPSRSKSRSASPFRSKSRSVSPDGMEGVDGAKA